MTDISFITLAVGIAIGLFGGLCLVLLVVYLYATSLREEQDELLLRSSNWGERK